MNLYLGTNVPLDYHRQDTDIYCGPACVQMMLSAFDIGAQHVRQDELFKTTHQTKYINPAGLGKLASWPDGMANALNESLRKESVFMPTAEYAVSCDASYQTVLAEVLNGLLIFQSPSAVLIDSGAHWVVIHGFSQQQLATPPLPGEWKLILDVLDPWPALKEPDYQHDDGSPCIGGKCVPEKELWVWDKDKYNFNLNAKGATTLNEKYVAVVPHYFRFYLNAKWLPKPFPVTEWPHGPPQPWLPDNPFGITAEIAIGPQEARRAAERVLEDCGPRRDWRRALARSRAETVMLVEPAGPSSFGSYFFVVLERAGTPVALVLVGTKSGTWHRAQLLNGAGTSPVSHWRDDEVLRRADGQAVRRGGEVVQFSRQDATVSSALAWRFCQQTRSPFLPLYQIRSPQGDFWLDTAGRLFGELTDPATGG